MHVRPYMSMKPTATRKILLGKDTVILYYIIICYGCNVVKHIKRANNSAHILKYIIQIMSLVYGNSLIAREL